ncbi:MAG: hypothetical protein RI887_587 [Actinomycetota bacterium]|jgi:hypothetical protein
MPRTSTISIPELKMCKINGCSNIATGYTGHCYDHDTVRDLRNYSSSPLPRRNTKNPMGIEIECYNPETRRKVTHVAQYVCSDGSLPSGGGEIKLCAPESKLEDIAADTVQRSRLVGNRVNSSCGLHIHMKIDNLHNAEARQRLFRFSSVIEDYIFDIVSPSRQHNSYCGRVDDPYYLTNHHSWISLSSRYPTLEVRIHGGTMNPWKVKGWVNAWKQVRPDIQKIVSGEDGWKDILESYADDGFLNKLSPNSIGYKYIQARSLSGGTLKNFGFGAMPRLARATAERILPMGVDQLTQGEIPFLSLNADQITEINDGIARQLTNAYYPGTDSIQYERIEYAIFCRNFNSTMRDDGILGRIHNSSIRAVYFPEQPTDGQLWKYRGSIYIFKDSFGEFECVWLKLKDEIDGYRVVQMNGSFYGF